MNYEVTLNGITYDLRKIKEEDECIFYKACLINGTYDKPKGFFSKLALFIELLFYPFNEYPTNESIKAYTFFNNRKKIKDKIIEKRIFKRWEL